MMCCAPASVRPPKRSTTARSPHVEVHRRPHRPLDLVVWAAEALACSRSTSSLARTNSGERRRRCSIGVLRHEAQCLPLAASADEDGDAGPADRLRRVERWVAPVRPLESPWFRCLRPHLVRDRSVSSSLSNRSRSGGNAKPRPLTRRVPGRTDPEPGPTAGDDVERGRGLHPQARRAVVDAADHQADPRPLGVGAMKPSAVLPSSIGASGGPPVRIWKKWSMTQIESKPTSSAVRATRARVGPMAAAPPGQVKLLIWSPNLTPEWCHGTAVALRCAWGRRGEGIEARLLGVERRSVPQPQRHRRWCRSQSLHHPWSSDRHGEPREPDRPDGSQSASAGPSYGPSLARRRLR